GGSQAVGVAGPPPHGGHSGRRQATSENPSRLQDRLLISPARPGARFPHFRQRRRWNWAEVGFPQPRGAPHAPPSLGQGGRHLGKSHREWYPLSFGSVVTYDESVSSTLAARSSPSGAPQRPTPASAARRPARSVS